MSANLDDNKPQRLTVDVSQFLADVPSRLARIESDVEHIKGDVAELKTDLNALRAEVRLDFRWLITILASMVALMLASLGGILTAMAKGFHWLG